MALAPDESGILGGQKWHLHTEKLHFCGFQGEQRGQKGGIYRVFFLQNGCSGRGCLNNICIASYGVGAKFFTTNLMSVDIPQMARIHHQGVQQSLLHQTTATPPTECTERTEPSCRERTPTDDTDEHRWLGYAVLPQNSQNTQNLAAWVWQGCHTLLICEHPCSSVGGSSLPEGSVCSVRSAGEHRSLVGAAETAAPPTE